MIKSGPSGSVRARTTDTWRLNLKFIAAQIQIQIPLTNKYLGVWYKGLVFCRNNGWISNGKHGQGTHSTIMGADSPAKNTPNALKISAQNVCPSPKFQEFWKKKLSLGVHSPGVSACSEVKCIVKNLMILFFFPFFYSGTDSKQKIQLSLHNATFSHKKWLQKTGFHLWSNIRLGMYNNR